MRIITARIAVLFGIVTVTSITAVILGSGRLSLLNTVGLFVFLLGIAGFAGGVWAVVHGKFEPRVEVGLTIGIITAAVVGSLVMTIAGRAIWEVLTGLFQSSSPWWILAPIVGTAVITLTFGLHRR